MLLRPVEGERPEVRTGDPALLRRDEGERPRVERDPWVDSPIHNELALTAAFRLTATPCSVQAAGLRSRFGTRRAVVVSLETLEATMGVSTGVEPAGPAVKEVGTT